MGIFSREMSKRGMDLKETSCFAGGFMLATPIFMALVIFIGHFLGVFLSNFIINILNSVVGFFLMYWGIKDIFFKTSSKKKDEKIKNITEEIKNITDNELKELFKKNKALLNGHFKLSSGLHSDTYFQSALILQSPRDTARVAKELANRVKEKNIRVDVVISPAMGGIVIGHAVGRSLGVRSIFTERVDGIVSLRRGFSLSKGEKVLVVEDVITTGLSIKELLEYVRSTGAELVAIVSLVDRSAGTVNFGLPQFSILTLEVKNYTENDCPMCRAGSIAVKPGSRE
jgi:orotate phosphoribosyltransferase